ncbi:transposase [Streptosporangium sp. NPDC023963]|uniref:transposase n=1 Tax=Streptosporangium sp. NPDC023963 TaxID=3155608 RepID=UPI00341D0A32
MIFFRDRVRRDPPDGPTDEEREKPQPFFPSGLMGRPRDDDRRVLNGIVREIRSGAARRDVTAGYGSRQSICTRFRRPLRQGRHLVHRCRHHRRDSPVAPTTSRTRPGGMIRFPAADLARTWHTFRFSSVRCVPGSTAPAR